MYYSCVFECDARQQTALHIALHFIALHSRAPLSSITKLVEVLTRFDVCDDAPVHVALDKWRLIARTSFFRG